MSRFLKSLNTLTKLSMMSNARKSQSVLYNNQLSYLATAPAEQKTEMPVAKSELDKPQWERSDRYVTIFTYRLLIDKLFSNCA